MAKPLQASNVRLRVLCVRIVSLKTDTWTSQYASVTSTYLCLGCCSGMANLLRADVPSLSCFLRCFRSSPPLSLSVAPCRAAAGRFIVAVLALVAVRMVATVVTRVAVARLVAVRMVAAVVTRVAVARLVIVRMVATVATHLLH